MKQRPPFPVTRENLKECWESIDCLRQKARRKAAVAGIGGFLANLFFLFSLLFVVNGLIYSRFEGPYHVFLADLPLFPGCWDYISGLLLKAGDSLPMQAGKLLLAAYGASIALLLLLTLVVSLVYHPKKQLLAEGTYVEQTAQLANIAREARSYSYKTRISTSIVSTLLVIAAAVGLLLAYAAIRNDAEAVNALLTRFPTGDAATNCLLYVLAAYFVCGILSWVLLTLTRPLYRFEFPYDYVVQAESAAIFALEEEAADAAALREEALALELEHNYGNAKSLLLKAALRGDVSAMEHYARHCLIGHMNDSARYWLERCVKSGQASPEAKSMLYRMKWKLRHNVRYLQPEAPPLTRGQKAKRRAMLTLTILWRIFILVLLTLTVIIIIVLVKSDMDIGVFAQLSDVIRVLFE